MEPFTVVKDPSAWYPAEVRRQTDWIYHLTVDDIAEVDGALKLVAGQSVRKEVAFEICSIYSDSKPIAARACRLLHMHAWSIQFCHSQPSSSIA